MNVLDELTLKMIDFYAGDAERIQHFMKVHRFGELIAKMEGLSEDEIFLIETATIVRYRYSHCGGKIWQLCRSFAGKGRTCICRKNAGRIEL